VEFNAGQERGHFGTLSVQSKFRFMETDGLHRVTVAIVARSTRLLEILAERWRAGLLEERA
jgi:hypothetical protein